MRLLALVALLALLARPAAAERMVTDSAGREVAVPDRIERVFAAGPPASILLYVLAPERMIGWPRAPHAEEMPYIAHKYRDLPEVGWLTGRGDTVNLEVLLQSEPDLILDFGSVRETYVSLAERVQQQTGIPYILIDGTFENTAAALRLLGEVLGVEERAERLAAYVEDSFAEIGSVLAEVPEAERPRVYLARGPNGQETGLVGSINTEIIERVGAVNVARDPTGVRRGLVQVPIEQVVVWNPDTVITWNPAFYEMVWNNFYWQGIDAVQAGRVYLSPTAPFGWIDRPPSLNRMIGLKWLTGLFYPEQGPQDLPTVTRDFYKLFYHVDLDDQDLDRLLEWAQGRAP
jgi:iron complex transport system substrate-binding protein